MNHCSTAGTVISHTKGRAILHLRRHRHGTDTTECGHYGDANDHSMGTVVSHTKGQAILHLGRHRHGTDTIESGEQINLIVWARNSA